MAPPLPHMELNMVPLAVLMQRVALDAFKTLKERLQELQSESRAPNTRQKVQFLETLVTMRERFVKLYVLCKWSRNHELVGRMIDIFAWLREQNTVVSHCIGQFGELKGSLMAAKMLEPDLNTAMEVFSDGKPDLPTYNYLQMDPLDDEFVYKVLQNLNVELSLKMALQVDLPAQFSNYEIRDGRVNFDVHNHFKCSVSMLKDEKFNLIDFQFGFKLIDKKIVSACQDLDPKELVALQNVSNEKLISNNNNLHELFQYLFDYSSTYKLRLIHNQLVNLKLSLWRGHLSHTYDSDKKIIKINYWIQRKSIKPSYIEIGLFDNNKLSYQWYNKSELVPLEDTLLDTADGVIDLELVLNDIIKRHIESDISNIKINLIEKISSSMDRALQIIGEDSNKLLFKITPTREVVYGIDRLTGSSYFENPTLLMNNIAFKMNSTEITLDYIELLRLKLEFQTNKLTQMMKVTGWTHIENVIINKEERFKLNIDYQSGGDLQSMSWASEDLTKINIFRRKDWQNGWVLLIGTFGWKSNIQIWCGRIDCLQGIWKFSWVDDILIENDSSQINLDSLHFNSLLELVKISSSKLISNLVINEFQERGCILKVMDLNDPNLNLFLKNQFDFNFEEDVHDGDNAVVLLSNESWLNIHQCEKSLVLLINVKSSKLKATLYGKLNKFDELPDISFSNSNANFNFTKDNKLFRVDCEIDLASKLIPLLPPADPTADPSSTTQAVATADPSAQVVVDDVTLPGAAAAAAPEAIEADSGDLIMTNVAGVLDQFNKLLGLLEMISRDSSLKVNHAALGIVGFSYGQDKDEKLQLIVDINGLVSVELPLGNPHNVCLEYLNKLINSDHHSVSGSINDVSIKQMVVYLKLTLKFYKVYQKLMVNEGLHYKLMIDNMENFSICYFNKNDLRFDLNVSMQHKRKRISSRDTLFMISLNNVHGEGSQNVSKYMEMVFSGQERITSNATSERVLCLRDSICCDQNSIGSTLEFLHQNLCKMVEQ